MTEEDFARQGKAAQAEYGLSNGNVDVGAACNEFIALVISEGKHDTITMPTPMLMMVAFVLIEFGPKQPPEWTP